MLQVPRTGYYIFTEEKKKIFRATEALFEGKFIYDLLIFKSQLLHKVLRGDRNLALLSPNLRGFLCTLNTKACPRLSPSSSSLSRYLLWT